MIVPIETIRRITEEVARLGCPKAAAYAWGVHPGFVRAMLRGEKRPGAAICEKLGLPATTENRGGKPTRGHRYVAVVKRPRKPAGATAAATADLPPLTVPSVSSAANSQLAERAAAVKGERMPQSPSPVRVRRSTTWARRLLRWHLRRERGMREYQAVLAGRIGKEARP